MAFIKGWVDGADLNIAVSVIADKSNNFITAEFEFSSEWDGADAIVAHFEQCGRAIERQIINNKISEDANLRLSSGYWELSLFGLFSNGKQASTKIVKFFVDRTGNFDAEAIEGTDQSLIAEDILEAKRILNEILAEADKVKADADRAEENANKKLKNAYELAVDNGFEGTVAEWLESLVGPHGPKGDRGLTGDKGVKGDKGSPGYTPVKGIDYFDGEQGPKGDKGDSGEKGDRGDDGYTPVKGIDYFDGEQGPKGDKGDPGNTMHFRDTGRIVNIITLDDIGKLRDDLKIEIGDVVIKEVEANTKIVDVIVNNKSIVTDKVAIIELGRTGVPGLLAPGDGLRSRVRGSIDIDYATIESIRGRIPSTTSKLTDSQMYPIVVGYLDYAVKMALTDGKGPEWSYLEKSNARLRLGVTPFDSKLIEKRLDTIESKIETGAGKSAYDIAVQNGFVGTEEEWLESLKGDDGAQGIQGPQGPKGDTGMSGPKGDKGDPGNTMHFRDTGVVVHLMTDVDAAKLIATDDEMENYMEDGNE